MDSLIVTSSNAYVVKALARRAGFPEERVLGIELQTQGVVTQTESMTPIPSVKASWSFFWILRRAALCWPSVTQ